jgi:hypothetical protein
MTPHVELEGRAPIAAGEEHVLLDIGVQRRSP